MHWYIFWLRVYSDIFVITIYQRDIIPYYSTIFRDILIFLKFFICSHITCKKLQVVQNVFNLTKDTIACDVHIL